MRLIVFLAFVSCVFGVQWMNENKLQEFLVENNNTLVGYVGSRSCKYDNEFEKEVESAASYLDKYEVKVALINAKYDLIDKTTPTLIFNRVGHAASSIWWGQSGREIAQYVKIKLQLDLHVLNITTEKDYNTLLKDYKTVFFGNFTGYPEQFLEYNKVAEQFNTIFMQLPESSSAFPNMNYSAPSVYAQHYYLEEGRPIKYTSGSLYEWVRKQIYETVTEITDKNSNHAFRTPFHRMTILFAPKSSSDFNGLVKNFTRIVSLEEGKLAAFYADSESSSNKKLMNLFEVPKNSAKIVIFHTDFIEKGLFTKTCSNSKIPLAQSNYRMFIGNNNEYELMKNFNDGIKPK